MFSVTRYTDGMQAFHFRAFSLFLLASRALAQDVTLGSSGAVSSNDTTAGVSTAFPTPPSSAADTSAFVSSLPAASFPTGVSSTDSTAPEASPGVFAPASIIGVIDLSSAGSAHADDAKPLEVPGDGGSEDGVVPHTTFQTVTTARRPPVDFTGTAVGIIVEGSPGSATVVETTSVSGQDATTVSLTTPAADEGLTVQSDVVVVPAFKPTRYRVLPLAWAFRTDRQA
jgi:hypothetical protein